MLCLYIAEFLETVVANSDSNTVSVIDTRNNILNDTIAVGENPTFIETIKDYIYVANSGFSYDGVNGTVSVIDTSNNTVIDTIALGGDPTFIETDENGTALYVATSSNFNLNVNGTVSAIDTSNNTVIDTIMVGQNPTFIEKLVVDPETIVTIGDYLYVANTGFGADNGTVSAIDTSNNILNKTITVGIGPRFIETFGLYLYVANYGSNTLSSIDGIFDILNDTTSNKPLSLYDIECKMYS